MNTLSNDPTETAAVLHGILAGPIAPTVSQRAAMDIPALVIGHQVDRIHPFHDAEQLARRLPRGQLVQANSVLELRVHPERLTERDRHLPRPASGTTRPAPTARWAEAPRRPSPAGRPPGAHSSKSGRRFRFRSDSCRLAARRRSLAPREGRVGRRAFSTWRASAIRWRKRSTASWRLRTCERSSSTTTRSSGPEALEQAGPLTGPERGGAADVEAQLHPRVDLVGVLAAGTAARAEPDLQLGDRDGQRRAHPHHSVGPAGRAHGPSTTVLWSDWLTGVAHRERRSAGSYTRPMAEPATSARPTRRRRLRRSGGAGHRLVVGDRGGHRPPVRLAGATVVINSSTSVAAGEALAGRAARRQLRPGRHLGRGPGPAPDRRGGAPPRRGSTSWSTTPAPPRSSPTTTSRRPPPRCGAASSTSTSSAPGR